MRIIAGKYRGHPLVSFHASHIRPTTDRVKETLFNMFQLYVPEAKVLDLFSGTGNLGLESLSRGANSVLFVEKNRKSIDILKQNIQKLRITEDHKIIMKDVITFLKTYEGEAFDVIFADPPFTESMADEVMITMSQSRVFAPHTVIAIESSRKEKIQEDYQTLIRYDSREFGDKILSLFRPKES